MAIYVNPLDNPDAWNTLVLAGSLRTPGKCKATGWHRENEYDVKKGKGTSGATPTLKAQPPAKGSFEFWAWTPAHFEAWGPILAALAFDPSKAAKGTAAPATTPVGSDITGTSGESSGAVSTGTIPKPGNTSGKSDGGDSANNADGFPKDTAKEDATLAQPSAIDAFHPALADIDVAHVLPPEKLGIWEEDGEGSGMYKRTIEFIEFKQATANSIASTPTGSTDQPAPGSTVAAGGSEGPATDTAANNAGGAAKDAQGAHGAP